MSTAIVVPYRPDGAERDRNWSWLEKRYRRAFSEWEVVVGQHLDGQWCKGLAVQDALTKTRADRLVIADADVVLSDDEMKRGVDALDDYVWVAPHGRTYRLTEDATPQFMAGTLTFEQLTHDDIWHPPRRGVACGGLFFIRREVYESTGFDKRFRGWSAEDLALTLALEVLYGPPFYLDSFLIHMYHEPQEGVTLKKFPPGDTDELVGRYRKVAGDPNAMRTLIDEGR